MKLASRLATSAVGSALAIALLTAPTGAGAPAPRAAKLDGILKSIVSATGSPGAVLLVQTPTSTWQRATGVSSIKPRQAMKTTGRFRVASVTKVFTAAVVLRLAESGTLSLDDTVERWLPGRVPGGAGAAITSRQLLSHTSGLADLQYGGNPFGVDGPPGPFRYANWNFNLLGEIIAAATSSTCGAELARLILRPPQLSSTELLGPTEAPTNVVRGYSPGRPRYDFTAVWRDPGPAAGLISTATDLARFERALFTGNVVSSRLVGEMQTPGPRPGVRHGRIRRLRPRAHALPVLVRSRMGPSRPDPRLHGVPTLDGRREAHRRSAAQRGRGPELRPPAGRRESARDHRALHVDGAFDSPLATPAGRSRTHPAQAVRGRR